MLKKIKLILLLSTLMTLSAIAAADYLHRLYGVGQINCTRA